MKKIITPSKICIVCKKSYTRKPRYKVQQFLKSLYCSNYCRHKGSYEVTSGEKSHFWKGGKPKCLDCGIQLVSYKNKRCRRCWDKFNIGKNNANFNNLKKNVGYKGIHLWIKDRLGSPIKCFHCGFESTNGRKIHWANKSHKYIRDFSDWFPLCVSCHRKYDHPEWNVKEKQVL